MGTGTIPTFPPPPMSATLQREQAKRKRSPKATSKKPAPSQRPRTPLQRSRTFLLPAILVLAFTVLILGVIYAYCVASPHTNLTKAQLASPNDIEIDDSIFSRSPKPIRRDRLYAYANGSSSTGTDGQAQVQAQDRVDESSITASLIFYTLTAPIFTIMLVSAELILSLASPSAPASSPIVQAGENLRPRSRFSLSLVSRRAHYILLTLAILNIVSLVVSSSFWTHCELPAPNITKTLAICPREIRGHWMGGIHEVSIAKVTLGWLLVVGLITHTIFVWRNMKAQRRKWAVGEACTEAGDMEVTFKLEEIDVENGGRRSSRVRFT